MVFVMDMGEKGLEAETLEKFFRDVAAFGEGFHEAWSGAQQKRLDEFKMTVDTLRRVFEEGGDASANLVDDFRKALGSTRQAEGADVDLRRRIMHIRMMFERWEEIQRGRL